MQGSGTESVVPNQTGFQALISKSLLGSMASASLPVVVASGSFSLSSPTSDTF